jgi:hypothetical protein
LGFEKTKLFEVMTMLFRDWKRSEGRVARGIAEVIVWLVEKS